jgi:NDP-sugar pyrophosphorylase family protein
MNNELITFKNKLTVIILCGGEGQRLRPLTYKIPKPLVKIKNKTILDYIISHFHKFKIKNIIVATGYKHNLLKKFINKKYKNNNIKVINTGLKSNILQRIKKIKKKDNNNYLVCYGDTLVDIDIDKLINFYLYNNNKIILSSYELKSSFGILTIDKNNSVKQFKEKPNLGIWFNIGYILFSKKFSKLIEKFSKFESFLDYCSKKNLMKSFKHKGKHITINTITELENAKIEIDKF